MHKSCIVNMANMSFNAIRKNKFPVKICEFTVVLYYSKLFPRPLDKSA